MDYNWGIFRDKDLLVDKIRTFGVWGPLVFLLLQAFQVMFPVIPGGASCLAGVLAFGPVFGFIYNYVGLTLGLYWCILLISHFGDEKLFKHFLNRRLSISIWHMLEPIPLNGFSFWGILVPGLPDDLLCYVAGLSNMKFRTFIWIILVGKTTFSFRIQFICTFAMRARWLFFLLFLFPVFFCFVI